MDEDSIVALVGIICIIGIPMFAWIISRMLSHRERIEMIRHGYVPPPTPFPSRVAGAADYDPDALVEAMFAGKKAVLRPIYDEMLRLAFGLGEDVRVSPGKTIVPFYRKHVFAQVKPTTATRVDIGFALKDMKPSGKLISTGGFEKGDRITHRIPITSIREIDTEVKKWFGHAYKTDV